MRNDLFCQNVLKLIGQPYAQTDCIGVVRKAAEIRCQGTNWLWRSYKASGKYKYLTHREDRPPTIPEVVNGMLVFRIKWGEIPPGYTDKPNCHHVGVIIDRTVVQSNPSTGVCQKDYVPAEWDACGWLKQVEYPTSDETDIAQESPQIDLPLTDHQMILAIYRKLILGDSID